MLDNIPRQKQVLQDIYNILSQIAVDVQPPQNVSISTSNNIHTIQNFGYNLNPKHYGSYEYAISLKIGVDYNIKNLTATVLTAHIGNIFPKIIREVDENTNKTTIDGIECKFYNNGICASPINKKETKCKNIPSEWCYFKQLAQAKEEIAFLQNTINHFAEKLGIEKPNYTTQKDFSEFMSKVENSERMTAKEFEQFSQLKEELEEIKKEFQIEYLQDNTTGKRTYRSLTLLDVEQERDELKTKVKYLHSFLRNRYNYGTFRPMWGAYLLKHLFNENLGDFFDEEAYKMADTIEEKEKQLSRHEQALIEIENDINSICEACAEDDNEHRTCNECNFRLYKDIINKANKEQ
ncbi:MAG: hypothetical protein DKM24_00930 [Candidatus Melainabacteria bacterium]|nr:MAG: hypothetical protein DKM24_00930 [Candidatus Melainabacteria bacterium]